jgi:hypothetical protein
MLEPDITMTPPLFEVLVMHVPGAAKMWFLSSSAQLELADARSSGPWLQPGGGETLEEVPS